MQIFPEGYFPFPAGTAFSAPTRMQKAPVPVLLPPYSRGKLPGSRAVFFTVHLCDVQCQRTGCTVNPQGPGRETFTREKTGTGQTPRLKDGKHYQEAFATPRAGAGRTAATRSSAGGCLV